MPTSAATRSSDRLIQVNPLPPQVRRGPKRTGAAGTLEVFVANEQGEHDIGTDRCAELVRLVLTEEGVRGDTEFALLFVDEPTMSDLNRTHMAADGPTDVLAFPIDDHVGATGRAPDHGLRRPPLREPLNDPGPRLLGDVVICPAVARRHAGENSGLYPGHSGSLGDEIDLLVVHGILHILGHDHAEPEETAVMQAAERRHLAAFAARTSTEIR